MTDNAGVHGAGGPLARGRSGPGDVGEPTVFFPEHEVEFLFDLVRNIVAVGASAVFISHDLAEVRNLCDRVVVLRDGEVAG